MRRTGKIAPLPFPVCEELSPRLAENEDGATLLERLNAIPGVPAMPAPGFAGEPISKKPLAKSLSPSDPLSLTPDRGKPNLFPVSFGWVKPGKTKR